MAYRISLLLLVFVMVGCQQRVSAQPVDIPTRDVTATIPLYEFVNPALEQQLGQVADSCFREWNHFLELTILPESRLYGDMPDVDPEQGAPYNAKLRDFHPDYYDIKSDSIFFSEAKACVKVGRRLCIINNPSPEFFRKTGRRYTERHSNSESVCICAEDERYLMLGADGTVQRVYPFDAFVPWGPIDSIVVEYPTENPEFPDGKEALARWIAERISWPDDAKVTLACFTIEVDGRVTDVKAPPSVKDAKERAFIESLRPLLASMPRWKPGKIYGKTFRTRSLTWLRRPGD